jgi:hypothetical protein
MRSVKCLHDWSATLTTPFFKHFETCP